MRPESTGRTFLHRVIPAKSLRDLAGITIRQVDITRSDDAHQAAITGCRRSRWSAISPLFHNLTVPAILSANSRLFDPGRENCRRPAETPNRRGPAG